MKRSLWFIILFGVLLVGCQQKPYEAPQSFAGLTGLTATQIAHVTMEHEKYRSAVTISSPADLQTLYSELDTVQYARARNQPTEASGPGGAVMRIVSTINKVVNLSSSEDGHLRIDGVDYFTLSRDAKSKVVNAGLWAKALAIGDVVYQQMSTVQVAKKPTVPEYPDVPGVQITVSHRRQPLATLKPGATAKIPAVGDGSSYEVEIVFPKAFDIKSIGKTTITSEIWHFAMNSGAMKYVNSEGKNAYLFGLLPYAGFEGEPPKDKSLAVPIQVSIQGVKDQAGDPFPLEFTLDLY